MKTNLLSLGLILTTLIACNNNQKTEATTTENQEVNANPDPAHNAQNSLDWAGKYTGTLPCADCEGIAYVVTLNADDTFEVAAKYLPSGDNFVEKGNIMWHDGTIAHLKNEKFDQKYKVVENALLHLDENGRVIEGQMAELYRLSKK